MNHTLCAFRAGCRGGNMLRIINLRTLSVAFAIVLISVPALTAQEVKPGESAPIPAQILTGKKVFISNAGVELAYYTPFKDVTDADQPYIQFYTAMKNWGRYEL